MHYAIYRFISSFLIVKIYLSHYSAFSLWNTNRIVSSQQLMWNFRFQIVSRQNSLIFRKKNHNSWIFTSILVFISVCVFFIILITKIVFFFRISSFSLLFLLKYAGCLQNREQVKFSLHVLRFSFFYSIFIFAAEKSFSFSFLFFSLLDFFSNSPVLSSSRSVQMSLVSHVFELQISQQISNFLHQFFFCFQNMPKHFRILVFRIFYLFDRHFATFKIVCSCISSRICMIFSVQPLPSL